MEKKCRYCGAKLPEDASFCPHCARSQLAPTRLSFPKPGKKRARLPMAAAAIGGAAVFLAGGLLVWHKLPEPGAEPAVLESTVEATVPEEQAPKPTAAAAYGHNARVDLVSVHGKRENLTTYYNEYTSGGTYYITYHEYYPNGNTAYSLISNVTRGATKVYVFREDGTLLSHDYVYDAQTELEAHGAVTAPQEETSQK